MWKLNLRQLILLLTVSTAMLVLANTFYTSHQTQRELLIAQTLETNQAYAAKMASSIEDFLSAAQQQLAFAAKDVVLAEQDPAKLEHIVTRLKQQTDSFNSVSVINTQGTALAVTPKALDLLGNKIDSLGAKQALRERKPLISTPYVSVTGRLLIFISHPVFDAKDEYLGFIGGTIYLHEENILQSLIGRHYHSNEAYIYVVDQSSKLIYHQESERVGEIVLGNPVIEQVISGQSGSMQLNNSQNIAMLAGYASVPSAGWGVVTQRTLNATLSGMNQQMLSVAKYSFPFFLLIMFVVWVMSKWISRPLWQLARSAESLDKPNMNAQIASIHAWYFEASQLRRALLRGLAGLNKKMGKLSMENITDPLTGLINRRGMQATLNEWEAERQPFSVIMCDIDHFKQVNDTFGHAIGDQVLQFVAKHMLESSREGDLVCRVGGEEFMLLLPHTDLNLAKSAAERLRLRIAGDVCPSIGQAVTLSFGVSSWIPGQASITEVTNSADLALYSAKKAGRNRVHDSATIAS